MKTRINAFLFLFVCVSISACVTKPVKEGSFQKAQWETKALIKDLGENKNQSLNIDILAIKNERARFEITALLGYQIASLTMSSSEISYIIYPQKVFYYGRNSESAVQQMIGLSLHPMNLTNIAFDQPVRGPGWKCVLDRQGLLLECENSQKQMKVVWSDRKEGQKKVSITAPKFEMLWHFSRPQTEVQFQPDLFTLKQPNGFKAIHIN